MADQSNRLTKSGLTMVDVYKISKKYYKSAKGDDKKARMKLDIKSAKVVKRNNYQYDFSLGKFVQTGRDVKLEFIVTSDPVSYKKTDNIKLHRYPVIFLIHNIELGVNSTFRLREGSLKKPIFKNVSMTTQQIGEKNIRAGIDMHFVYSLMFAYKKHGILFGRNFTSRPPVKTNKKMIPYFGKHSLFIFERILVRMIGTNGGILAGTNVKNK
jgi:hypothetical protein